MAASLPNAKRCGIVIAVSLLLVTAGCSGGSSPGEPSTNATTVAPTTAPASNATTVQPTTDTTGEQANGTTDEPTTTDGESRTAAASGEIAVVVDDRRLDVSEASTANASSPFWIEDDSATAVWQRADANVTLAEGLATLGVTVTDDGLSYDGTTYRDAAENTSVAVRVNGDSVDADEYVLQQSDEVWVVAVTHPLDQSVPGTHIDHDELHVHGTIEMTVNGEAVNFSRPKYETPGHNQHFHFEGDTAPLWHAHSWSVTLGYAVDTLPGMDVTEDSVTYDNTTYERSDSGTSLTIAVNGDPVDPSTYVLKDGDEVTIEVESTNSSG